MLKSIIAFMVLSIFCTSLFGQITADDTSAWLILYNLNDRDSITWANWYCEQWNIPATRKLGLNTSTEEHLDTWQEANEQIFTPVRTWLSARWNHNTIGIVVGYKVPGHFEDPIHLSGVGGYSIANALVDPWDDFDAFGYVMPAYQRDNNPDCPLMAPGNPLMPNERLTRETMTPGRYMVARIDGPDLASAQQLTLRAKEINLTYGLNNLWYDYNDPSYGNWHWLNYGCVNHPDVFEESWNEFDSDTESIENVDMRFGWHDINGWNDGRLETTTGKMILAHNLNSWGATTVRSVTAEGGRYVPNALAAGYAAAIGSTGEPGTVLCPMPGTLVLSLKQGWTLGESFYISQPFDDFMWTLVGDPFLQLGVFRNDTRKILPIKIRSQYLVLFPAGFKH